MKIRFALLAMICTLAVSSFAVPAVAQFKNADDAVDYRQAAFTVMGNHLGRLAAMAKGDIPFDAEQAERSAVVVQEMSTLPWEGFVPGSTGDNSKVKGDPWAKADEFKKLQEKMIAQVDKLPESASSLNTLRTQVGATGKACKDCHDKFREE